MRSILMSRGGGLQCTGDQLISQFGQVRRLARLKSGVLSQSLQQARELVAPVSGWFTEGFPHARSEGGKGAAGGAITRSRYTSNGIKSHLSERHDCGGLV